MRKGRLKAKEGRCVTVHADSGDRVKHHIGWTYDTVIHQEISDGVPVGRDDAFHGLFFIVFDGLHHVFFSKKRLASKREN
jgi:hypothetical protein